MRTWTVAAVAVFAACKGGAKDKAGSSATTVATPTVDVATVLAMDDVTPPFLLIVDARGDLRLAAAASWADLDAKKLRISKHSVPLKAG